MISVCSCRIVEVRACPPAGQRIRIDMNNLVGVLRSPGRLIQGDLDFVNLGWAGMAQVSDSSDSPSIVPGFLAVTGTTGATGSVEFEVRVRIKIPVSYQNSCLPAPLQEHSHALERHSLAPTQVPTPVKQGSKGFAVPGHLWQVLCC